MSKDVEIRGRISESQYERLVDKYPGDFEDDDLSDTDLLGWMVPQFLRMLELEEAEATGRYPPRSEHQDDMDST